MDSNLLNRKYYQVKLIHTTLLIGLGNHASIFQILLACVANLGLLLAAQGIGVSGAIVSQLMEPDNDITLTMNEVALFGKKIMSKMSLHLL